MEIFRALMQIFVGLAGLNIVLSLILWRATKFRPCLYMVASSVILLVDLYVQGAVAGQEPFYRILAITPYQFFLHYFLALILSSLIGIPFSLKKIWYLPIVSGVGVVLLNWMQAPAEALPMVHIVIHSSLYFYVVYQAFRHHRAQLTPSLWALCTLYVLFGLHLYDYAYFYVRFDLFAVGFTLALMFFIAFAILIPAAIIEKISLEKARLETEMRYRASLIQASKMGALGEMAGGVAHELNNPLAVLLINLESLEDDAEKLVGDPEVRSKLERCLGTVDRMSHIVKSLLLFSQEDQKGERVEILLKDLVENTTTLFAEKLQNRGIEFKLRMRGEEISLFLNPAQISQVILNLISNSIDALETVTSKKIFLEIQECSSNIEFCVRDNGPGLSALAQERLFQPFFTTKEAGKGMGLGLSIAKGIIQSHNGTILYERRQGDPCFVFQIPLSSSL